jgi:hypothetical protein
MTKRRKIDNTMAKRRKIDNTMTKRRKIDNTMAKRRKIDNTMHTTPGAGTVYAYHSGALEFTAGFQWSVARSLVFCVS